MVSSEEQDTGRVGGVSASGARIQKKRPAERPPSNVEDEDAGAPVEVASPGAKKKRRPAPIRVNLEPPALEGGEPGSFDLSDRQVVDKPNGRYNKNGVCYHKASNKWRAIVYVDKKQVNLGYYNERDDAEHQVNLARLYGLPKDFKNLRALQQPKRSDVPGVNWDTHCKRWLGRVYQPSGNGTKGKEHKVGYFLEEKEAAEAVRKFREELGLPPKSRWRTKKGETPGPGPGPGPSPSEPPRVEAPEERDVAQLPPSASAQPVGAGEVIGSFADH